MIQIDLGLSDVDTWIFSDLGVDSCVKQNGSMKYITEPYLKLE
jgi:hypothetical protein